MFSSNDIAGLQPFGDWFTPDSTQRHPLGLTIDAVDPYWGGATFIYVKAESTMEKGSLVQWNELWVASDLPNTANLGRCFGVLMNSMVTGQYGWAQVAGLAVLSAQASVAADTAVGVAAAGQVGANSAGKQLLGVRNVRASTATVAKTNTQTTNGSAVLKTNGYDGWFLGMALSGTGVPASTVVAKLDPDGRTVYMGSVIGTVDKLATATGSVTVTGTYTGYLGTVINHPFVQGAIT
jgi:hypothetical protein